VRLNPGVPGGKVTRPKRFAPSSAKADNPLPGESESVGEGEAVMKIAPILAAATFFLAACQQGDSAEPDSQFNDIATGASLADERPLQGATPAERATSLAECSATLTVHATQTPPPPRAARLSEQAERLSGLALRLAQTPGSPPVDVARVRDERIAAIHHLAQKLPGFPQRLLEASDRCDLASVMTDEELTQGPAQLPPIDMNMLQ
jgi:hypothetical protein